MLAITQCLGLFDDDLKLSPNNHHEQTEILVAGTILLQALHSEHSLLLDPNIE